MAYTANTFNVLGNVLVIGLDFGTTYSGVAWATPYDLDHDRVNVIDSWPGSGHEKGKAPTELYRDAFGKLFWGYDVPPDVKPMQWFKLLLLKDEDLYASARVYKSLKRCRRMLQAAGCSATDAVADYLRQLWAHTLETVGRERGQAALDGMALHVVLTVPAIWKGYARQSMKEAAWRAGILDARPAGPTELSLVTEPEAAMLAMLKNNPNPVRKGDVFVVCDAGGGTVDLISYRVTQDAPTVVMKEAAEGTGGLFGGVFIDAAFLRMAKERLGRKWTKLSKAGVKELVDGEWQQTIKPQYRRQASGSSRHYTASIPAEAFQSRSRSDLTDTSAEPHIKMGRFYLSGAHIEPMFHYSLRGIDGLIDGQLRAVRERHHPDDAAPAAVDILLVGGLGSSPYLFQHLAERHGPHVTVRQSAGFEAWTAVCRGAVYKGMYNLLAEAPQPAPEPPIRIASMVARFSVGITMQVQYDEAYHRIEDREWDEISEHFMATNQMQWYLYKGTSVEALIPVVKPFRFWFRGQLTEPFCVNLFSCNEYQPPGRVEGNVKSLCQMTLDINAVDSNAITNMITTSGKTYKNLHVDIVMVPTGAAVDFQVECNGRRLASSAVQVLFT